MVFALGRSSPAIGALGISGSKTLPPGARDSFLRSIAGRLVDIAAPSDADIAAAVNFVLSTRGISTPAYLCDGATLTNRRQSRRKIFFATVSRSIPKQEEQSMRHKHFDDDNFDRNGLLKDGHSYRARMTMMDSAMPHRPNFARITDGTGNRMGLHRPGWRVPAQDARDPLTSRGVTDAGRQAVADARQRYNDELTSAWKHPAGLRDDDPITAACTHNMRGEGR
jgi:hypothetical protein